MLRLSDHPADRLYQIAHNAGTGRPLIGPRAVGVGLVAAVLGELMLDSFVTLDTDGRVYVNPFREPYWRRVTHYSMWVGGICPSSHTVLAPRYVAGDEGCPNCGHKGVEQVPDELQGTVWSLIRHQPVRLPPADWLSLLELEITGKVAGRLKDAGFLQDEEYRSLFLGRLRYRVIPVLSTEADLPRTRLRQIAERKIRPGVDDLFLAGLVDALTLTHTVLGSLPDANYAYLATVRRELHPHLLSLISAAKAAADAAVTGSL